MDRLIVAQIVGNGKLGGVISCIMNYYRNINHDKIQFHFYIYEQSEVDDEIRSFGGEIFYMPKIRNIPAISSFLKESFEKNHYDIVHSHLTTLNGVVLKQAKKAGIPVRISHAHSTSNKFDHMYLVKSALKVSARKHATNLAACGKLSAQYLFGKKSSAAHIINNAIELDTFGCPSADEQAKLKSNLGITGLTIGFVGRFAYQKNCIFLIKAFAALSKKLPDAVLVMVGDGEKAELEKLSRNLGVRDKIIFTGTVKNPEIYYKAFDIFWLPSKYEGLPLVAIEAQCTGLPGIYSSTITNEIDIGKNNSFLKIDNTEKWADISVDLLQKLPQRVSQAQELRAQGFDIKEQVKLLEKYYFSIAAVSPETI